jgi:uncharacterized membrane protein
MFRRMNRLIFVRRPRLSLGVIAGVAGFLLAPTEWSTLGRVLAGWNAGILIFLLLIYPWMIGKNAGQIEKHYAEEDPSAAVILLLVTLAALLSLIAIVVLLSTIKQAGGAVRTRSLWLSSLTIIDSWVFVATMFTLHYADMFYSTRPEHRPLAFPGTSTPVFTDFVYFSFTIAAACQTSDVATTQASIRRVVTAHTIVSFLFNVSVLGFAVNVSAGLLGN